MKHYGLKLAVHFSWLFILSEQAKKVNKGGADFMHLHIIGSKSTILCVNPYSFSLDLQFANCEFGSGKPKRDR